MMAKQKHRRSDHRDSVGRTGDDLPPAHRGSCPRDWSADRRAAADETRVSRVLGAIRDHGGRPWRVSRPSRRFTNTFVSLRRFALVLTRNRDDAEDLVQETLTRAIASVDSYQPDTDLRAWLFRIMNNTHISSARKRQVRDAARMNLPDPVVEATQSLRVEIRQVLAALDELPDSQREAILLMALDDLKYKDAAQVLDVPLGTFMSRISRGREALRRAMEGVKSVRFRVIGGRP